MTDKAETATFRLHPMLSEQDGLAGVSADNGAPADVIAQIAAERCDEELAAYAIELYRLRRRREHQLGQDLLGEPCWDILLDLFANTVRGNPVSVTGACLAGNVPTTTSLRWLATLEERGLLKRSPDPFDRRVVLLRLTNLGLDKMRAVLTEISKSGF